MDINSITYYMNEYGLIFLMAVVFLEYLNLPGLPAGIILPMAGIAAKAAGSSIIIALFLSVVTGLIASWILYYVGLLGGNTVLIKYVSKFPTHKPHIDKCLSYVNENGAVGLFIARLLPGIRTLISVPAGVAKMNMLKYTLASILGITLWNLSLIAVGYYFGDKILTLL